MFNDTTQLIAQAMIVVDVIVIIGILYYTYRMRKRQKDLNEKLEQLYN